MKKKEARKSHTKEDSEKTETPRSESAQKILVENFVALQGVMTDLSSKLNNLANQISKLLQLFEESAKTFMEKDMKIGGPDKDVADKLDKLLEQNKIIARGLALLHETNAQQQPQPQEMGNFVPQPQQFTAQQQVQQRTEQGQVGGYQRSQR